jgi:hypothetical protein
LQPGKQNLISNAQSAHVLEHNGICSANKKSSLTGQWRWKMKNLLEKLKWIVMIFCQLREKSLSPEWKILSMTLFQLICIKK